MTSRLMTSPTLRRAAVAFGDGMSGVRMGTLLFAVVVVVIFTAVGLIVSVTGGFEGAAWTSVWEQVMYAARYYPLSLGAVFTWAFLPLAVSLGVTRASYFISFAGLTVALSLAIAVLVAAGHLAEYGLFAAGGAVQEFSSPHLFTAGDQVGWVALETVMVGMPNMAAGALIAMTYYKWRWLRATLALPLTLVPLVVAEGLMSAGWFGNVMNFIDVDRGPLALIIPATLIVTAAMIVATFTISRHSDIRTSSG